MVKISPELVRTLQDFSRSYAEKREKSFAGLDFEALREQLSEVKDLAIEKSDELLDKFMERAVRRGSQVHLAASSQEANKIIYQILKERGISVLVKGKSMVSEETGLNDFLHKRGIEACETDLGEWIIQLAGEAPTHMVMPAIHLNRMQVAEIFSRRLGEPVPGEISGLVKVARRHVRSKILQAGAGLSGANALLAEEGAILLVTNEGNGRLVTSVPPVHIVLTSREKVLPSLKEALLLLKVLTRNATGQEISSYVSVIAGPPRDEQHIIVVDNNRSKIKEDYEFREVLRCIKCSACLNVCPVYQMVGGQEFSYVYMGGIGSLLTAWVHGLKQSEELASYCLTCHRCDSICSTKIPVAELVRKLRKRIVVERGGKPWKKAAFDFVLSRPAVEKKIFAFGRAVRTLISKEGKIKFPLSVGILKRLEKLPVPAEKSFSALLAEEIQREKGKTRSSSPDAIFEQKAEGVIKKGAEGKTRIGKKDEAGNEPENDLQENTGNKETSSWASIRKLSDKGKGRKVAIFPGCLVENFFPEVGLAAFRLLRKHGFEVEVPFDGCCGFPAANSGFVDEAKKEFEKVASKLLAEDYYCIITLCPTCTSMLRELGPELLEDEEEKMGLGEKVKTLVAFVEEEGLMAEKAEGSGLESQLAEEIDMDKGFKQERYKDGSEKISKVSGEASSGKITKPEIRIAYHDSCHHKFVLKEDRLSRRMLREAGFELAEMENPDFCCGFAGVFSVEHPEVSEELLRQKLEAIEKSGAEAVVMDCPGCMLQIKGGLLAAGKKITVKHTADILAASVLMNPLLTP